MEILLWTALLIVAYVYFGYPLLLVVLSKVSPAPRVQEGTATPKVSLIIPAYNEEMSIGAKLVNSLSLVYPRDKIETIVVSDGSNDETNNVVSGYKGRGVKLVASRFNQGKSMAENAAVAQASGEILFFTDATVKLRRDAVRKVVARFADLSVGCVVGKVTYMNDGDTSVSDGEGIYWRYELFLRRKESELGNLAMGSGPIMAIRRNLFQPLDPNVGEDFVLPMQVFLKGFRVIYEPEAVSEEVLFQNTASSMYRSKIRIITKDLRGLFLCRATLNPFRHPLCAWGLISHKLLRWLVPYFLILLFTGNLFLLQNMIYKLTLGAQLAFYMLAVVGYFRQTKNILPRLLGVPFSFCLVNMASLVGVAKFVARKKTGRWVPVRAHGREG